MLSRRSLTLFLAVALCLPLAAAELRPAATQAASTLAFANAQFAGVWNRTATLKVAVALAPAASTAVQVTGVFPGGKSEPGADVQLGTRSPSSTSVAVATKVAIAPVDRVASRTMSVGTLTWGGVFIAVSGSTIANGEREFVIPHTTFVVVFRLVVMFKKPVPPS